MGKAFWSCMARGSWAVQMGNEYLNAYMDDYVSVLSGAFSVSWFPAYDATCETTLMPT